MDRRPAVSGRTLLTSLLTQLSLTQEYTSKQEQRAQWAQCRVERELGPPRTARPRPRQTSATIGLAWRERGGGAGAAFSLQERRTGEAETEDTEKSGHYQGGHETGSASGPQPWSPPPAIRRCQCEGAVWGPGLWRGLCWARGLGAMAR